MPFLSIKEETYEALRLVRLSKESDDQLVSRILEFARCYMLLLGMEDLGDVKNHQAASLKNGEMVHSQDASLATEPRSKSSKSGKMAFSPDASESLIERPPGKEGQK